MKPDPDPETGRRALLRFLAGSPWLAFAGLGAWQRLLAESPEAVIDSAEQALNVMDFEPAARRALPPAHFGYLATGVDDDLTLRANREAFARFQLRPRRLLDLRQVDTSVRLFGEAWETPIALAPVASQRAFHPEAELGSARAARARNTLQILSGVSTSSVEEVNGARGAPVWYQLYPTDDREVGRAIVKRAEAAGCPALVLTVDLQGGSNRESAERFARRDTRACSACHQDGMAGYFRRKPMFDGLDVSRVTDLQPLDETWDSFKRLRDSTRMKVLIKGIVTREDAVLAVASGADGVIVSNHGGRAEESGRGSLESLPEVVAGAAGRIPVLVDGGFRRGGDVFKALALGATAICIGRPYIWGLAAFGQAGVEAVLGILRRELEMVMRQAGTTSVAQITRAHLAPPG
jgi:isopentenyl diphosphate isomerase/L-lactate dehydrogenase-like FMN-dependent dehydrogenase